MKVKALFALAASMAALVLITRLHLHTRPNLSENVESTANDATRGPAPPTPVPPTVQTSNFAPASRVEAPKTVVEPDLLASGNKLQRLAQTRERFQTLAAGDPTVALQAAKQISDETERETALLALVTQWTHGELRSPRERSRAINMYGLEAGLGIELTNNPELAVTWANELTDGPGRLAMLHQTAIAMAGSDPSAAFALAEQLPEDQRRQFFDSVFAGWAGNDTQAALDWAAQLPDEGQRDDALRAIRTAAPVGIGTQLAVKDGYPVVQELLPGTPAELSGQIHPGDRILALAQGDNSFVDAHGMPLSDLVQMLRGTPGTTLQLQILSADAPPNSSPQTISIVRDQIKFKH